MASTSVATLRAVLALFEDSPKALGKALQKNPSLIRGWLAGRPIPEGILERLERAELLGKESCLKNPSLGSLAEAPSFYSTPSDPIPQIDLKGDPAASFSVVEAERLALGHLSNSTFGLELSPIDPLPHQRIAVYEHLLLQSPLRFLLADDAGAGKTIMTGLYIREMLLRRSLERVLIVSPSGLVSNWQKELLRLFQLSFRILSSPSSRLPNPFLRPHGDLAIVSLDTLAGETLFSCLKQPQTPPYDLVVFDEAHKLAARMDSDGSWRRTDRYRLAEALAGACLSPPSEEEALRWSLPWQPPHLLLLTATPHMGREDAYFALWHLLDPLGFSSLPRFQEISLQQRAPHFLRRTKEELLSEEGRPLFPTRLTDTLSFELSQGPESEQALYDQTSDYLRSCDQIAQSQDRSSGRLILGVFQRRLASSTYALRRSLQRRKDRLHDLLSSSSPSDPLALSSLESAYASSTADEDQSSEGREALEIEDDQIAALPLSSSQVQLSSEIRTLQTLCDLALRVEQRQEESKFLRLLELLHSPEVAHEKILLFTEHRDTLDFLFTRLESKGYAGQIAQIHGGMPYPERDQAVAFFRRPSSEGGARFCLATDAAGEGINLQFCWIMVNYDLPWNPARLEQRMGRIHRYGQKHDPVRILNLLSSSTREGRVFRVLLQKLEAIRQELSSEKVFDVLGRLFENIPFYEYLQSSFTDEGASQAQALLQTALSSQAISSLQTSDAQRFGVSPPLQSKLPSLRADRQAQPFRSLLPGYLRHLLSRASPLLSLHIQGDLDNVFAFAPSKPCALDFLWPALEELPHPLRRRLSLSPPSTSEAVFFHPGHPLFHAFRQQIRRLLLPQSLRGSVFLDPHATEPSWLHIALFSLQRHADLDLPALAVEESLSTDLLFLKHSPDGSFSLLPRDALLSLAPHPTDSLPPLGSFLFQAHSIRHSAHAWLSAHVLQPALHQRQELLRKALPEREDFLRRSFNLLLSRLLEARRSLSSAPEPGSPEITRRRTILSKKIRASEKRQEQALLLLKREIDLLAVSGPTFLAHILVLPPSKPPSLEPSFSSEALAMALVQAAEEAEGAQVLDVSTPDRARKAGLSSYPGFDLLSLRPDGSRRCIEVKGRLAKGSIELTLNEWLRASNLGPEAWLYVVFSCASSSPEILRIQDPAHTLAASTLSTIVISERSLRAHLP